MAPDVVIGHHPDFGIVASSLCRAPNVHYLLGLAGFRRITDHPFLYGLAEPGLDDGRGRAAQAVAALRASGYCVGADIAAEPDLSHVDQELPSAGLRPPEPDVVLGLHPQLGVVAAVADGQELGASILRAHGFGYDRTWDFHVLPGPPGQGMGVVARATGALGEAGATFAVHPRLSALASFMRARHRDRSGPSAVPPMAPSPGPRRHR